MKSGKNKTMSRGELKKLLPTKREIEALSEADDMISNATDGAKDQRYWRGLLKRLRTVRKKIIRLKNHNFSI